MTDGSRDEAFCMLTRWEFCTVLLEQAKLVAGEVIGTKVGSATESQVR